MDEKRGGVTFNPLCEHEPNQENAETFMEGLDQVLIITLLCPFGEDRFYLGMGFNRRGKL